MRSFFSDLTNQAALARKQVELDEDYLERWYARRYGRPSFSGNFEDRSVAAWRIEMLRDLWRRRSELQAEVQNQNLAQSDSPQVKNFIQGARKQLMAISSLFGLTPDVDEEAMRWIEQAKRGDTREAQAHVANLKVPDKLKAHLERLTRKAEPAK